MTSSSTDPLCSPKTGWMSGETYCRVHGRDSGWPCKHDILTAHPAVDKDEDPDERATVEEAIAMWEEKGPTSLTAAVMADALYGVREEREKVQKAEEWLREARLKAAAGLLAEPDPHAFCPDAGCSPECPARIYPKEPE